VARAEAAAPQRLEALETRGAVVAVALGEEHAAAVTADGAAYCWGAGEYGQLANNVSAQRTKALNAGESRYDLSDRGAPRPVRELAQKRVRVVGVACGERHTAFLGDACDVWGAGDASCGALGVGAGGARAAPVPTRCEALWGLPVTRIAAGDAHTLCITAGGALWGWGRNNKGQLGIGVVSPQEPLPRRAALPEGAAATAAAGGGSFSVVVSACGACYAMGDNRMGQLGRSLHEPMQVRPTRVSAVEALTHGACARACAAGTAHALLLCSGGRVIAWGANEVGQCGTGAREAMSAPAVVRGLPTAAVCVAAGADTSVALCSESAAAVEPRAPSFWTAEGIQRAIDVAQASGDVVPLLRRLEGSLGKLEIFNGSFRGGSADPTRGTPAEREAAVQWAIDARGAERAYNALCRAHAGGATVLAQCAQKALASLRRGAQARGAQAQATAWSAERVRFLPLVLQSPAVRQTTLEARVLFADVTNAVRLLPRGLKEDLVRVWRSYPTELLVSRLIRPVVRHIAFGIQNAAAKGKMRSPITGAPLAAPDAWGPSSVGDGVPQAAELLKTMWRAACVDAKVRSVGDAGNACDGRLNAAEADCAGDRLIHAREFAIGEIARSVDLHLDFLELIKPTPTRAQLPPFCFCSMPFLLDAEAKRQVVCFAAMLKMGQELNSDAGDGEPPNFFEISVRRTSLVADGAAAVLSASRDELARPLRIHFVGEDGVDHGGPLREFFQLALAALTTNSRVCTYSEASRTQWLTHGLEQPSTRAMRIDDTVDAVAGVDRCGGGGGSSGLDSSYARFDQLDRQLRRVEDLGNGAWVQMEQDAAEGTEQGADAHARTSGGDGASEHTDMGAVSDAGTVRSLGMDAFRLMGLLIGLAVHNGVTCALRFPPVLWRRLLLACREASGGAAMRTQSRLWAASADTFDLADVSYTLDELAGVDSALAETLGRVLHYDGDVGADMGLFFTTAEGHELYPGSADEAVTNDNREEFVKRYIKWVLRDSVKAQLAALCGGFAQLVAGPAAAILTPDDLEQIVCGLPHLDFKALEASTRYEGGYSKDTPVVRWFWKVVHSRPLAWQRRLLTFVTASARAPLGGLGKLGLTLQRAGPDTNRLPTASTCFHVLLMPEYADEAKVASKLDAALRHAHGFGNE